MATVVAIAGMPGSGKSQLMRLYENDGYIKIDDLYVNEGIENMRKARESLQQGKNIIVSDREFCLAEKRQTFEKEIGTEVQWVFFENNPYQCAKNVLYRRFIEKQERDWCEEICKIEKLSKTYLPMGDVRAVAITPPLL